MTIHYHGTPITPNEVLLSLAGRHFCVSYERPDQVRLAHQIGQSVMLDNGAFSVWRREAAADWPGFYRWCDEWLDHPNTWAIIPDVIAGDEAAQDALIADWPHGERGAPVWHMHEDLGRLLALLDEWPRVCVGSSKEFAVLLTDRWCARMDAAWNAIAKRHRRTPWVHMLRGMQLAGMQWPFASVDSTDIGRNHPRPQNTALAMASRWDGLQCSPRWQLRPEQAELFL